MSHYLIASVPIHGHVAPLLAVAAGLVHRGHHVQFLTGARFSDAVERTGSAPCCTCVANTLPDPGRTVRPLQNLTVGADMPELVAFDPADAGPVSSWAESPRDVMNWCSRTSAPVPPAAIIAWSDDADTTAFALSDDDMVVGYGELRTDDEEAEVELARLIIDPARRRRGYGRRLATELTARALRRYPTVTLRVNPENNAARFCYESAGFCRVDPHTETMWNADQPHAYTWMLHAPSDPAANLDTIATRPAAPPPRDPTSDSSA